MRTSSKAALVGATVLLLAFALGAEAGPLPTFNLVFGNGGEATAYFIGEEAGDTDDVSVLGVAALDAFFSNHAFNIGDSVVLGTYADGAEIEFSMSDVSAGNTWYTGPAFRNADGFIHANVTYNIADIVGLSAASYTFAATLPAGTLFVGFEDLSSSGRADFDYNDVVFAVVNARPTAVVVAAVPEPASLALLGIALAVLGLTRRKRG